MRNLVLLGFHVGDDYFVRYSKGDAFPQVAAYKLEARLLSALRSTGVQVRTVASIAVSTFPRIKRIWFPSASLQAGGDQRGLVLPLINLPAVKMATRFFGSFYSLLKIGRKVDGICVYAAHSPNLLAAYLCSKIYKLPYYVYIPDLPGFMDVAMRRGVLRSILKKIDAALLNYLVSEAAGLLVISRPMVEDMPAWRSRPYLVLEGIADSSPAPKVESGARKKTIFYAGGVNRAYGIEELVEGFLSSGIDYELVICGRGDLEDYLVSTSARHASVKYLGFLPPAEVAEHQAQAAALVLSRNPAEAFTRYSFPSKLIEYMSAGIPVLTTRLEGIPAEYFEYLNVIEGFSAEAVAQALVQFCSSDQGRLSAKAELGKIWVLETKTSIAVGKRVIEFMENSK
ncbi:glycosyltransferase [Pseudomonas japonica]|uniref:glycosyltransferase n=1 Tax=Pseudomonas japonica TaxID=256466 RepID=UPI00382D91F0